MENIMAGSPVGEASAAERFFRNTVALHVVRYIDPRTILSLRCINKPLNILVNDYVIFMGARRSGRTDIDISKAPLQRRAGFSTKLLRQICEKYRANQLTTILVNFAKIKSDFIPTTMGFDEVIERVKEGWCINFKLRELYKEDDKKVMSSNYTSRMMREHGLGTEDLEYMMQASQRDYIDNLSAEECFNFLMTRMYFEIYILSAMPEEVGSWMADGGKNRQQIVWFFIHHGARYIEDFWNLRNDPTLPDNVTLQMLEEADASFMRHLEGLYVNHRQAQEAFVQEISSKIRTRVLETNNNEFKKTMKELYIVITKGHPIAAKVVQSDFDRFLYRFLWY